MEGERWLQGGPWRLLSWSKRDQGDDVMEKGGTRAMKEVSGWAWAGTGRRRRSEVES